MHQLHQLRHQHGSARHRCTYPLPFLVLCPAPCHTPRASCGHDLTWYTWQLWHRLYTRDYGPIPPGAALPPLPKPPPTDYAPPPYNAGPGGDHQQPVTKQLLLTEWRHIALW
jgi:hypothetical protein